MILNIGRWYPAACIVTDDQASPAHKSRQGVQRAMGAALPFSRFTTALFSNLSMQAFMYGLSGRITSNSAVELLSASAPALTQNPGLGSVSDLRFKL